MSLPIPWKRQREERFEAKEKKIVLAEPTELIKAMIKERLVIANSSVLLQTQSPEPITPKSRFATTGQVAGANAPMIASHSTRSGQANKTQSEVILRITGSLGRNRKMNSSASPSLPVIITNFRGQQLEQVRTCFVGALA